jgi:putative oxidoreductase
MFERIICTDSDLIWLLARLTSGIIIIPYGVQKVFRQSDWPGIKGTVLDFKSKKLPAILAYLVIAGQFAGSLCLIMGFLSRFAATCNFIIFIGALVVHFPQGWSMNWFGKKRGEGIEYFVLLLTLLGIVVVKGGGAFSLDLLLCETLF